MFTKEFAVMAERQPVVIWPMDFPEAPLIEWAKEFLRPEVTFVDIGAHVGTYALSYAPLCKAVYAFEPQRLTFCRLCAGISLNRLTNVYPKNVALADSSRSAELKIISTDGGGSSIKNLTSNINPIGTEIVECRTLDSYALESVGFIKIDVEGAELEVLKGATNTIQAYKPKILMEVWDDDSYAAHRKELSVYLEGIGYKHTVVAGFSYMWVCEPKL